MTPIDWILEYDFWGGWMLLPEFIEKHGSHTILVCDEGPISVDEMIERFGEGATVEYLGEQSPYFLDNDGLYFLVRSLTKKGIPRIRGGTNVVVYPEW